MAIIGDIGDAVVTLIQAGSFSQPYTIAREWVETQFRPDMKESDPIEVSVVPATLAVEAFDLDPRVSLDWDLGLWIVKIIEPTVVFIDPIAEFVEQVVDRIARNRQIQASSHKAKCMGISMEPAYDEKQLLDLRLYRSVIRVTYRVTQ